VNQVDRPYSEKRNAQHEEAELGRDPGQQHRRWSAPGPTARRWRDGSGEESVHSADDEYRSDRQLENRSSDSQGSSIGQGRGAPGSSSLMNHDPVEPPKRDRGDSIHEHGRTLVHALRTRPRSSGVSTPLDLSMSNHGWAHWNIGSVDPPSEEITRIGPPGEGRRFMTSPLH